MGGGVDIKAFSLLDGSATVTNPERTSVPKIMKNENIFKIHNLIKVLEKIRKIPKKTFIKR